MLKRDSKSSAACQLIAIWHPLLQVTQAASVEGGSSKASKKVAVVAFGGNALLSRGEPLTMEAQWQNATKAGAGCWVLCCPESAVTSFLCRAPRNSVIVHSSPGSWGRACRRNAPGTFTKGCVTVVQAAKSVARLVEEDGMTVCVTHGKLL